MKYLVLMGIVAASMSAFAMQNNEKPMNNDDKYMWLEEVEGKAPLDWVKSQNAITVKALAETQEFKQLQQRLLAAYDSTDKIPYANKMGAYYYNFWRDANNPKGIWRRTTLEEYKKKAPAWEVILDVDALAKADGVSWVYKGSNCLYPAYRRCLINLSRGGADATVVREFDLEKKAFVKDGFYLPESKGDAAWRDENSLYIGRDFGAGSMTDSGYPRQVRLWKRGEKLEQTSLLYEGKKADMSVSAARDLTKGFERTFYYRTITFYTNEMFYVQGDKVTKIDKPDDATAGAHREWLTISLKSDWNINGKTYPNGAVLVSRFNDFMTGKRDFQVLFEPGPRKSLAGLSFTKNYLLLNELEDVRNKIYILSAQGGKWQREPMAGLPELGTVSVSAVDDEESDAYWLNIADYLTPSQLWLGALGTDARKVGGKEVAQNGAGIAAGVAAGVANAKLMLKSLPAFFDARDLVAAQYQASSKDGTKIPYFMVHRKGINFDGNNPTLLYGYGGFQISMTPGYSARAGIAWLEKGGVYVVANIRGGGEFGPAWHQAALKAHRNKAYEDFIAVAEDLIARKVTRPPHLGIQGGSNGGMLMGNMTVLRPDLFNAVVCQVPLLDMQRYNKLLAGASWMAEYGNPDVPEEWAYLKQYSPYHNLNPGVKYPNILFTTSTRDDRVHPGHARKMAKKMMDDYQAPVLYYENIEGGHGGAADNKQSAFMDALAFTFLWQKLM